MISRLRHHGPPGLQADQWVSTAKTMPRTIVIGRILRTVWPATSRTPISSTIMALQIPCVRLPTGIDPPRLRAREISARNPRRSGAAPLVNELLTTGSTLRYRRLPPRVDLHDMRMGPDTAGVPRHDATERQCRRPSPAS